MLNNQIFVDGLGSISVIGGTVRLDFFSFSPTEKEANGQPKAVLQHRLVMPVNGFLHSAGKIQEAAEAVGKIGAAASATSERYDGDRASDGPVQTTSSSPEPAKVQKPPFP